MNKYVKQLLVLLLAVALLLAGCAKAAPAVSAPAAEAAPAAPAAAPAAETQPAAVEPAAEPAPAAEPEGIDLHILYEQDNSMINTYTVIAVNPDAPWTDAEGNAVDASTVFINSAGADALINWLLSEQGEQAAADYGFAEYGEYLFYLKEGRPVSTAAIPQATEETKVIRLSTTTSVKDSGLLAYLLPMFEQQYGYTVEVASAGTGKAIAAAKAGNADVILVHAKAQEEAFVEAGFARTVEGLAEPRNSFLYNFFVLCGPAADPAHVAEAATVKDAFLAIANGQYAFVSRGDNSGTHTKEISLWPEELGITTDSASIVPYTAWYTYSNAGMGACLKMALETGAYVLSDKATFLTFYANGGLTQ